MKEPTCHQVMSQSLNGKGTHMTSKEDPCVIKRSRRHQDLEKDKVVVSICQYVINEVSFMSSS